MRDAQGQQTQARSNLDVKEQIREYWSRRSESFDRSPAHGIHSDRELCTWTHLIGSSVQGIAGKRVLELASGTGEFTRVLMALGCKVEGLDLSEVMIEKAKIAITAARDVWFQLFHIRQFATLKHGGWRP